MEVHHHPHVESLPAGQAGKRFKEYFLEFIMIFLAVTLGFIAENIREHFNDKANVKILIRSLVEDLQTDTTSLDWIKEFRVNKRQPLLDSFYHLLNVAPQNADKKKYYSWLWGIQEFYEFRQSDETINQLKNAGYLRYFSDEELLKRISEYEFFVQDFKNDEDKEYHLHYDKLIELIRQNSDNNSMYRFYVENNLPDGTGIEPFSPEVLQSVRSLMIELMWYNNTQMPMQIERIKSKAVSFIEYLHHKYNQ